MSLSSMIKALTVYLVCYELKCATINDSINQSIYYGALKVESLSIVYFDLQMGANAFSHHKQKKKKKLKKEIKIQGLMAGSGKVLRQ